MNKKTDKDMVKIPVLNEEEVRELGRLRFHSKHDELAEKIFWKEVYGKRGLEYEK